MKKYFRMLLTLAFIALFCASGIGMTASRAEEEKPQEHKSMSWTGNDEFHWRVCIGEGECPEGNILDYGPHDFHGGYVCNDCGYDQRVGFGGSSHVSNVGVYIPAPEAGGVL